MVVVVWCESSDNGGGFIENPKVALNWIFICVCDTAHWDALIHPRIFSIAAVESTEQKIKAP